MSTWPERFPELFAPSFWEWGELDVRYTVDEPPDDLISNVHVIGRTPGGIIVCTNDLGWRFLPGGTRKPDETIEQITEVLVMEPGKAAEYLDGQPEEVGSIVRLAQALRLV